MTVQAVLDSRGGRRYTKGPAPSPFVRAPALKNLGESFYESPTVKAPRSFPSLTFQDMKWLSLTRSSLA